MLTLPIKKKWFDMIVAGEKLEEYRANNAYYDSRFSLAEKGGLEMWVALRNGYSKTSPVVYRLVAPCKRTGARPEWGGNPAARCWVLNIKALGGVDNVEGYA